MTKRDRIKRAELAAIAMIALMLLGTVTSSPFLKCRKGPV